MGVLIGDEAADRGTAVVCVVVRREKKAIVVFVIVAFVDK